MVDRNFLSEDFDRLQGLAPSISALPCVGFRAVAKMFKSVVLPEPEGPIIAIHSPALAIKDTWFSAGVPLLCSKISCCSENPTRLLN